LLLAAFIALAWGCGALQSASAAAGDDPPSELHAADLGVVINMDDSLSRAIGNYYITRRQIPPRRS
jgi:hypothetical protein